MLRLGGTRRIVVALGRSSRPISNERRAALSSWSQWPSVGVAQTFVSSIHEVSSVALGPENWWFSLAASAASLRLVTFPMAYYQQTQYVSLVQAGPELSKVRKLVKTIPGTVVQKLTSFRKLRRQVLLHVGTSPVKLFPFHRVVQIPLFVSLALGIRKMATDNWDGWHSGGFSWLSDLTTADPTMILPVVNTAIMLVNIERGLQPSSAVPKPGSREDSNFDRIAELLRRPRTVDGIKICLQGGIILLFPGFSTLPAGVLLFWFTNSMLTAVQGQVLSSPRSRAALGLPDLVEIAKQAKSHESLSGPIAKLNLVTGVARADLARVNKYLEGIQDEKPSQSLVDRINATLVKEKSRGSISMNLIAELREDPVTTKEYVAVGLDRSRPPTV